MLTVNFNFWHLLIFYKFTYQLACQLSPTFKQSSLGSLDSLSAGMFAKKEIAATRRRDKSSRTNDGDHILSTRFRREKSRNISKN